LADGYSIKFQGCHQISQWNDEVDGEDDVRIASKRLVRFRLCPTGSCSASNAKGCNNGYGDYIIDLETYLQAYFQAKQTYENYYGTTSYNENFDLSNYMTCTKNNNGYYIGPYCASQGGAIYLGMFTDDQCSNYADGTNGRETYLASTGAALPYSQTNLIELDCLSCTEPSANNYDGNDAADGDTVSEVCETLYSAAGKCESNLPYGTTYAPNTAACNYMEGIKVARSDGLFNNTRAKANKTASVFISLFVVTLAFLSAYVYYLKTKLDRASINLAD
jgi:hypothetical protein